MLPLSMSDDRLIPVISGALKQAGRWHEHGGLRVVNTDPISIMSFSFYSSWAVLELSERFQGPRVS
jgi:hypothetical protein